MEGQMDVGLQATTITTALEGRRCFSQKGISFQLFLYQRLNRIGTACTGLREPFGIIGLDWNHRLYRIGMASTAGTIREMIRLLDLRKAR